MTFPNPGQNDDLRNLYGYRDHRCWDLDRTASAWATKLSQGHGRLFELKLDQTKQNRETPSTGCITPEFLEDFHRISRESFRYIAERHVLTPIKMWLIVKDHLASVGMHEDDIEFCQSFIFGWCDIEQEQMERFRWRYPDRCPLLDVLCTMDDTHDELNQYQDQMLQLKGSKGRRRLDVIPPLPDPDGIRPCCPAI